MANHTPGGGIEAVTRTPRRSPRQPVEKMYGSKQSIFCREQEGREMTTPPCTRCGFDIETATNVPSTRHMLLVDKRARDEQGGWSSVPSGNEPYWVCGHCHAPGEAILQVVKSAGEQD
jgi:hypothetical protein